MASPYQPETAAVPMRRLPTLHEFFAPGGLLSKAHPNYEFRRGQLQMAEAVEKALTERRHLIVEAGTGTGKTLAYLLPVIRSGKRAELTGLPENTQLWQKLDARSERCTGQKCQQWDRCFITEMHRRAAESDIIIVNHHLFFADLSLRQSGGPDAGVLPDFSAVIFDEAHELEDVAGSYFGVSVSNLRFEELARDIEVVLGQKKAISPGVIQALAKLRERSRFFFGLLPPGEGRSAFP